MLLINLIFAPNISKFSDYLLDSSIFFKSNRLNNNNQKKSLSSLPFLISRPDFIDSSKNNLADKKFISRNLFTRLINNYCYQTIFLSVPNKESDKYIAKLNTLNIVGSTISQKYFLSQFSKSLINNSIDSSLSNDLIQADKSSSIRYLWKKSWFIPSSFSLNKGKKLLKPMRQQTKNEVNIKNLPLYVVTNHLNQMIISEPPEVSGGFSMYIKQKSIVVPSYQAWFFANYQDAEEYLQYIKKQYRISNSNNKLGIFICNLETFYRLVDKSTNLVQLRLIPDLHEVGQLVNKYSSYRHIVFNKNQKYGKDYFQGQPIYTINSKNYYYQMNKNTKKNKYRPVFTNYETAISSYPKLVKKDPNLKSTKYPELIVYNLEDFLQQETYDLHKDQPPFLMIPSKNSYEYTKNKNNRQERQVINQDIQVYLSYLKLWIKRVFWSLTSQQP